MVNATIVHWFKRRQIKGDIIYVPFIILCSHQAFSLTKTLNYFFVF